MKKRLDLIEQRLQALFEKSTLLFGGKDFERILSQKLISAMQSSSYLDDNNVWRVASHYLLSVNPEDFTGQPKELSETIKKNLSTAALEEKVVFEDDHLSVEIVVDGNLPRNQVVVKIMPPEHKQISTAAISITSDVELAADPRPENAFLILEGGQIFPLRLPVINIGRREENHLVINDLRVSRTHAQLRAVHGRYIILDLNATGGTYINGQRVTQKDLFPGDVISLAGVTLIYGEDSAPTDPIKHMTDGHTVDVSLDSSPPPA